MDIVTEYFDMLGATLPVMSASDEFSFLPRSQGAAAHYDRLDDLRPEPVDDLVRAVADFRGRFASLAKQAPSLEERIDWETLQINASGIEVAFGLRQVHRFDPLLHLKVAFIGIDHALHKPSPGRSETVRRTLSRLKALPGFLDRAGRTIKGASPETLEAAGNMLRDAQEYLREMHQEIPSPPTGWNAAMNEACQSLWRFERTLDGLTPGDPARLDLETVLARVYGTSRTPEDIYDIASRDRGHHLQALRGRSAQNDPHRNWQAQYRAFAPGRYNGMSLREAYESEISRLQSHFAALWPWTTDCDRPMAFASTPRYLRSVRSSASFAAAFSSAGQEVSWFYITPGDISGRSGPDSSSLDSRLLREAPFLSAHETWPGHHLLDSVRRFLANPVRRQVENPLFYEGWAYFAEELLLETGYLEHPAWTLVHHRRCLWRAVRCMIDCGLAMGRLDGSDCILLLQEIGFSPGEASAQVDRYRLNPGYQLCYTLGCHELRRLRRLFSHRLDLQDFCRQVLTGGEIPFHLLHQQLEHSAAQGDVP